MGCGCSNFGGKSNFAAAVKAKATEETQTKTNADDSISSPWKFSNRLGLSHKRTISTARIRKGKFEDCYELTDVVLGTGLSGEVKVGINKTTKQRVAIKTLNTEGISQKKWDMLYNEIDVYLRLDHPNICRLIQVFVNDGAIYLIMELCTGKELYERLAAKKRYSEKDAAKITKQMLEAIHYCHVHNICHRDLKLENWVYADASDDAPLKLIDFGFSKIFNPGIPMTAMHGTVYYVAPEVMDGKYNEACDIWSVGVIVYMILSGAPPFNGKTDVDIIQKIRAGCFSFEGQRWEGISAEAKTFVVEMLKRDPNQRPSAYESMQLPWILSNNLSEAIPSCSMETQQSNPDTFDIDVSLLEGMRSFAYQNGIKRAALGLIAQSMSADEMESLENHFKRLDISCTGTITLSDLKTTLPQYISISENEIKRVFECLDQTGDEEVHFSEFLAGCLQVKFLVNEQHIREAFQLLDVDGSGFISLDNLKETFGEAYNGIPIQDVFSQAKKKSRNGIDFDEFQRLVMDNSIKESWEHESTSYKLITRLSRKLSSCSNLSSRKDADESDGVPSNRL